MAITTGQLSYTVNTKEFKFGMLSVQDLFNINNRFSSDKILSLSDLEQLTQNPTGATEILYVCGKKTETKKEDIDSLSILTRTKLAKDIFIKSVMNGEENVEPNQ